MGWVYRSGKRPGSSAGGTNACVGRWSDDAEKVVPGTGAGGRGAAGSGGQAGSAEEGGKEGRGDGRVAGPVGQRAGRSRLHADLGGGERRPAGPGRVMEPWGDGRGRKETPEASTGGGCGAARSRPERGARSARCWRHGASGPALAARRGAWPGGRRTGSPPSSPPPLPHPAPPTLSPARSARPPRRRAWLVARGRGVRRPRRGRGRARRPPAPD